MNTGIQTLSIAEEAFQRNLGYSKWLWRAAWSIELVAAGIGLVTGWVTAAGTRPFIEQNIEFFPGGITANIILAGLPFFAIAIVELMKIPVAMGFYYARRFVWKTVFLISLVAIMLMTFETIFNGMERNFSQQKAATQNEINDRNRLISLLENEETRLNQIKSENADEINTGYIEAENRAVLKRDNDLDELNKNYREERNRISNQRVLLNERYNDAIKGTEPLEEQRQQAQEERSELQTREATRVIEVENSGEKEILAIQQSYQSDRDAHNGIIERNDELIKDNEKNRQDELAKVRQGMKSAVNARYDETVAIYRNNISVAEGKIVEISTEQRQKIETIRNRIKKDIAQIRENLVDDLGDYDDQIAELNKKIEQRQTFGKAQLDNALALLDINSTESTKLFNEDRKDILDSYTDAIKRASGIRETQLKRFSDKQALVPGIEENIEALKADLTIVEDKINRASQGFQLRRFTASLYGIEPAKVTEKQLGKVSMFWFGSIAAIVALLGTVLATASFVLSDREVFTPKNITRQPIRSSFRRLLLSRRKFYQKNSETRFANFLRASTEILSSAKERLLKPKIKYFDRPVEKIVTVTKEVPVDKVVYKEVPKEIIKKEMVYVPFYSIEGGTVDLTGEVKDLTDPEEIKQKIKQTVDQHQTKKKDTSKK